MPASGRVGRRTSLSFSQQPGPCAAEPRAWPCSRRTWFLICSSARRRSRFPGRLERIEHVARRSSPATPWPPADRGSAGRPGAAARRTAGRPVRPGRHRRRRRSMMSCRSATSGAGTSATGRRWLEPATAGVGGVRGAHWHVAPPHGARRDDEGTSSGPGQILARRSASAEAEERLTAALSMARPPASAAGGEGRGRGRLRRPVAAADSAWIVAGPEDLPISTCPASRPKRWWILRSGSSARIIGGMRVRRISMAPRASAGARCRPATRWRTPRRSSCAGLRPLSRIQAANSGSSRKIQAFIEHQQGQQAVEHAPAGGQIVGTVRRLTWSAHLEKSLAADREHLVAPIDKRP